MEVKKRTNYYLDDTSKLDVNEHAKPNNTKPSFQDKSKPMSMSTLKEWSRYFHENIPPNPYYKRKIPWKTILIVILTLNHLVLHLFHWRHALPLPRPQQIPLQWL